MPLPKRSIEPVHVARSVYQQDELQSVELETVTNTTLTNIIRQLSSLSKHAEDVFGELARDVSNIGDRANSLQARIDRLSIKVTQLDSTVEEVQLTDITRKKAFKSAKIFDQQIFSRATMPVPMLETYSQCDKPPPLDKLNVYRDDGKDGLKFYTDPNYFFELWRQEMLKDTERVMHDKGKKVRPRQDGNNSNTGGGGGAGGGANSRGHKKRVRAPHNTREKQRQIAIGHGETLMPNMIYRPSNSMINDDQTTGGYGSMGAYDNTRPPRPNSIELKRNYQTEQIDGLHHGTASPSQAGNIYNNNNGASGGQYASTYAVNGILTGQQQQQHQHQQITLHNHQQQQQQHLQQQQQQQLYEESMYHQTQALYGQTGMQMNNPLSPESIYAPGTPSRTKTRPSQPPPAPPSNGSGNVTPTTSNANTPTRGRSMSTSRDALPPPPPIPDGMVNTTSPSQVLAAMNNTGAGHIAAKLLARTNSLSRAGSPQLPPLGNNSIQDANALVMAQLNNTINNFNNLNIVGGGGGMQQQQQLNDLPPPPPVSSEQLSPPNAAPPPPPPPPPLDDNNGHSLQTRQQQIMPSMANGDIQMNQNQSNGIIMSGTGQQQQQHIVGQKKLLPPIYDPRNDLMKAIRDGITLRKVEKSEQKEIDRNTALHDVASILARRVAIELSESEDSDSDDSEGWVEPNETSA